MNDAGVMNEMAPSSRTEKLYFWTKSTNNVTFSLTLSWATLTSDGKTLVKLYNNRAYCFAKLAAYADAIRDYSRVTQLDPENIHALHNRGISYERLGHYKEAIRDFTRVIEIDPDNANAYFNRGCCYDAVGELDLAISDYSVALDLDMRNGGG